MGIVMGKYLRQGRRTSSGFSPLKMFLTRDCDFKGFAEGGSNRVLVLASARKTKPFTVLALLLAQASQLLYSAQSFCSLEPQELIEDED